MKKAVRKYIEQNGLDTPNRTRIRNYKRIIVAKILRSQEDFYSFQDIGDLMNRDHSTIVHMMKAYNELSMYPDFRKLEEDIKEILNCETLEERILKVDNMADLHCLQEEIRKLLNS